MQLVRCATCRLTFEASAENPRPPCRQCGSATEPLAATEGAPPFEPFSDEDDRKTEKLPIVPVPRR
jgi:hypothetical protein